MRDAHRLMAYVESRMSGGSIERKTISRYLAHMEDAFRRVIIVRDDIMPYHDTDGNLIIGLFDFLLNENSLDGN